GSARYNWAHGIEATTMDMIGDERIIRSLRVSVTLRKMKDEQQSLEFSDSDLHVKVLNMRS
ncbi:10914_t:CDS:1, partial [Acaulospora morrowiae]